MAKIVSSAELFNTAPNSNLPPFDVVVPKGTDPEGMAKDIVSGKIDVSKINTLVSSKELFKDENTISSAELFKDEKPITPKVTSKREKTLTDKVLDFASKYLGDQTPAEEGSGEATKAFVQGLASVASGGASWIPAGLSMTPITVSGKGIKLRSPQEMADTAMAIQESLTYTPKDKDAQKFAEFLARPITYAIEKGKDSGDYYKKLGDEAEARGEHKTAKLLWALGGATEFGGQALPFLVPVGAKTVKEGITPPKGLEGIVPTEQGKPYSITPDVSGELKSLKGEQYATKEGKVEVGNISEHKGTDEIRTQAETSRSDSVKSIPKTEEKITEEVKTHGLQEKGKETEIGKPAKAAIDINQELIDKGLEGIPERELARYNPMRVKEEIAKVLALKDREDFYDMAKGDKPIPPDVHPQILFNMADHFANKEGNIDIMMDLAKSPIAEQRSVAAQTMRMSQEGKPTNSVVAKIQEVKKSWESKIKDEQVSNRARKSLYEEVKKTNLPKEELVWEKFLETIKC